MSQEEEEAQQREFAAWEQRERARIARDRAESEREAKEAGERERLRNMSEEDRRQWERENPKVGSVLDLTPFKIYMSLMCDMLKARRG